jgi:hypothetical protein
VTMPGQPPQHRGTDSGVGELVIAIAMTEPGTGSDLQAVPTEAIADGDEYVIDGSKTLISNGFQADLLIATSGADEGAACMSLVVVETGTCDHHRCKKISDCCCVTKLAGSALIGYSWTTANPLLGASMADETVEASAKATDETVALNRREFGKRGAMIGGAVGAAWAAPLVIDSFSNSAAAAGTPPTEDNTPTDPDVPKDIVVAKGREVEYVVIGGGGGGGHDQANPGGKATSLNAVNLELQWCSLG